MGELPRHGLVERQVALAVHLQLAHLGELAVRTASSHGSVLKLQEPQPHSQPRRRPGLQQALGPLPPRVRRARDGLPGRATRLDPVPGCEHAELPPHAILLGRRPVRVEQVTLVEDGVRHRTR